MAAKKLDPTTAFMTGKIKIEGDMAVAMRLGKLFN
ncbi:SCP2 sterol-binding domain-containing protein [Nannocystis pusilla]